MPLLYDKKQDEGQMVKIDKDNSKHVLANWQYMNNGFLRFWYNHAFWTWNMVVAWYRNISMSFGKMCWESLYWLVKVNVYTDRWCKPTLSANT